MIYVVTHKKFDDVRLDSNHYKVIHVGKNGSCKDNYLRDDTDINISEKNPYFCELTALYWIWKNISARPDEIEGIVHYRRYFTSHWKNFIYQHGGEIPPILSYERIKEILADNDAIVPVKKRSFKPIEETYAYFHNDEDLKILGDAVKQVQPEYYNDYKEMLSDHAYYYANMIICRRSLLNRYSEWLFSILFEAENYININNYDDDYQKRVFGFMSERLLQVWIKHNNIKTVEMSVFNTEQRGDTIMVRIRDKMGRLLKKNG